jgi:hypothetical protein
MLCSFRPSGANLRICYTARGPIQTGAPRANQIASLESELGVRVVQAITARISEIQKRLKVHEPIQGVCLLEELQA